MLAFADDLVVMALTPAMQHQLQVLTDALSQSGLSVNPAKCQVSVMKVDGRHKTVYADAQEHVLVFVYGGFRTRRLQRSFCAHNEVLTSQRDE